MQQFNRVYGVLTGSRARFLPNIQNRRQTHVSAANPTKRSTEMKRNLILSLALMLLGGCAAPASQPTYRQISQEEAMSLMQTQTGYIILDVRTPEEFADKHIPGAMNIPNEDIGTEAIPQLPQLDQMILVYCRSGNRSRQAAQKLAALGYTNILEFGGITTWSGETVSGAE